MSLAAVRIALETKLLNMSPTLATAWENSPYTPVVGTPYQQVWLLPATPANPTFGDDYYREQGLFQMTLLYPLQTGPAAAMARAELIRTAFKRGTSMTSGTVTVIVDKTPEIGVGRIDGDRWAVPVKVPWHADII